MFYDLGADGTVGANKNTVKIIAEDAGLHAQRYLVYDSHKSGAQTISHLRFGVAPIRAPHLIQRASFVAIHQFAFVERHDVLRLAAPHATVLLNAPFGPDEIWDQLPGSVQTRVSCDGLRVVRHRCLQGGCGRRLARAHQYHPVNLLLRPVRCLATRPGDRRDQEVDQKD